MSENGLYAPFSWRKRWNLHIYIGRTRTGIDDIMVTLTHFQSLTRPYNVGIAVCDNWNMKTSWLALCDFYPIVNVTRGLRILKNGLSAPYLLKKWTNFDHITIFWGHGQELIRYWWPSRSHYKDVGKWIFDLIFLKGAGGKISAFCRKTVKSYRADTMSLLKIPKDHIAIKSRWTCFLFSTYLLMMFYVSFNFHKNMLDGFKVLEESHFSYRLLQRGLIL